MFARQLLPESFSPLFDGQFEYALLLRIEKASPVREYVKNVRVNLVRGMHYALLSTKQERESITRTINAQSRAFATLYSSVHTTALLFLKMTQHRGAGRRWSRVYMYWLE